MKRTVEIPTVQTVSQVRYRIRCALRLFGLMWGVKDDGEVCRAGRSNEARTQHDMHASRREPPGG
jgi:hypothetical protein